MKDDWPKNRTAFCKKKYLRADARPAVAFDETLFCHFMFLPARENSTKKAKRPKNWQDLVQSFLSKLGMWEKLEKKNFQIRFTGAPWTWKVVCSNPAREWKRAWMLFQQGTCFQWRRWHHLVIICKEIYFHLRILEVFRSAKRGFLWDFLKAMNERHSSESNRERINLWKILS